VAASARLVYGERRRGGEWRGGVALGLSGVPVSAETIALHTIFELVRVSGARVHLSHLSSAAGGARARGEGRGLAVTCDVTINHVHLTDMDIGYFNSQFRLDPPLRSQRDRDAIRAGLADGTIDAICSDHTPLDDDEKLLPFAEATPGATGLELLLSLTVKWAREAGVPLAKALTRITTAPAGVLKLNAGRIAVGETPDLCLFDPAPTGSSSPPSSRARGTTHRSSVMNCRRGYS
jgi:dihydroorotase